MSLTATLCTRPAERLGRTPGLLGIDEVEVDVARVFDGREDGRLRDFVEHDATRFLRVESEHFGEVPGDGFSFAVFIGCEPNRLRLFGLCAQFVNKVFLVRRYFVLGLERVEVHAKVLLLQVADMSVAGHHFIVRTEKLFDGLGFGR